jgi:CelD/BcsL family acetyltransferase involved in cellulose biosynthesis
LVVTDEQERLLAIAPWVRLRDALGMRRVTGLGGEDSWYHDPWLFPGADPEAVAREIAATLRAAKRHWDLLELILRPGQSPSLVDALKRLGWSSASSIPWRQHWTIAWDDTWETYWRGRPGTLRKNISNRMKRLQEVPHRFYQATPDAAKALLPELCRFQSTSRHGLRDWEAYHAYMCLLAEDMLERNQGIMFVLEIDGSPAALQFQSRHGDHVYGLLRAFDSEFERYSPGSLLAIWSFETMAQLGIRSVDLGPGHDDWKRNLRTASEPTVQLRVGSSGSLLGTGAIGVRDYLIPQLKQSALTRFLRSPLKALRAAKQAPHPV